MKILIIHNAYQLKGGEDTVLEAERKLLNSKGHQVEYLHFDNNSIKGNVSQLLTGILALYNPKSAQRLKHKIKEFSPDIIHVHNFFPIASPSIFYTAQKNGIPIILTLHNFRLICPSAILFHKGVIYEKSIHKIFPLDAIWKGVYRSSSIQTASVALITGLHKLLGTWRNKISYYIALTEFAKDKFIHSSLKLTSNQIVVKPNFVEDLGEGVLEREPFLLFIGRLTEEKGIKILLQVAKLIKIKIKILGDGELREMVEQSTKDNPNLEYLGFKSRDEVLSLLKKAKALLFPSLWYEGMPMVILESFSVATPVIASNLGGPASIIEHNVQGLLFEAGNVSSLNTQIERLFNDEELYKNLQKQARITYLEKYTPEVNYQLLISIYENAIRNTNNKKNL